MTKTVGGFLMVFAAACLLSGCAIQRTVPLASHTPTVFGNMKVYATENVPFEYEEVAFLAQSYNMDAYTFDECLRQFAAKAEEVKADAILDFKMQCMVGTGGFFLVISGVDKGFLSLSGVAVKIKRP